MELTHIDLGKLSIAAVNMRHGRKPPDVSDLLPSVRTRGILVPLLVRPGDDQSDSFEVVAGRRRYFAARCIVDEGGTVESLPCAVMAPGDDAAALEASLIENIARLDPDEVSQWETFTRLVRQGRTISEIAMTFGITDLMVKRRLALGNLLPRIREAHRREEIDAETVRHLTLASKAQQKDWLALFDDPGGHVPIGWQLKQWLFGGQSISTTVALFPLEIYPGQIVTDLFGEEGYFADADLFWQRQNEAIAAKRDGLLAAGWHDVVVLEPGTRFMSWEHEKTSKAKGGKVFITTSRHGEVEIHEGYLSRREARRARAAGETDAVPPKPARPEVTSPLQTYIELHRHAAVRAALLGHPGVALRLMVAHAIAGSGLWRVSLEPQETHNEAVAASLAASASEAAFVAGQRAALALLGATDDRHSITDGYAAGPDAGTVFAGLLNLSDDDVMRVLIVVMGETLQAGSAAVEAAGVHLGLDMAAVWQADDAFFDLIRDRQVVNAMLAEVGGQSCADANVAETVKTQKRVIRDCLTGANGRTKVEAWLPGWMAFPVRSYTDRGGFRTVDHWAQLRPLFASE